MSKTEPQESKKPLTLDECMGARITIVAENRKEMCQILKKYAHQLESRSEGTATDYDLKIGIETRIESKAVRAMREANKPRIITQ